MAMLSDKEIFDTYQKLIKEYRKEFQKAKAAGDDRGMLIFKAKGIGAGTLIDKLIPWYDPDKED